MKSAGQERTNNQNPKLSIIIPTFNSSGTIVRCLNSIAVQSFTDYEVLIQDGCSSDGTADLVAAFHSNHRGMNLLVQQCKDSGIYDAMNKATARARGDWVYFLGSDDELYAPNVLARVFNDSQLRTSDVVYGSVLLRDKSNRIPDGAIYDGEFSFEKLLARNISHQCIFYRRSFTKKIGNYNTKYRICADWDFNFRCWSKTSFKYIDVTVATFHAGGLSTRDPSDRNFDIDVAGNVLKYFKLSKRDPLVNTPAFTGFHRIETLVRPFGSTKYALRRMLQFIKNHLGKI